MTSSTSLRPHAAISARTISSALMVPPISKSDARWSVTRVRAAQESFLRLHHLHTVLLNVVKTVCRVIVDSFLIAEAFDACVLRNGLASTGHGTVKGRWSRMR